MQGNPLCTEAEAEQVDGVLGPILGEARHMITPVLQGRSEACDVVCARTCMPAFCSSAPPHRAHLAARADGRSDSPCTSSSGAFLPSGFTTAYRTFMSRHSQYTPSLQSARPGTEAAAKARKGVRRATRVARAPKLRERTALGGVAGGANADAHASAASSASPARVIAELLCGATAGFLWIPLFCMGFFFCHLVVGRSRANTKYTLSCTTRTTVAQN